MAKRVRPFEELPDEYVEQRLLLRRAFPEPEQESKPFEFSGDGDDENDENSNDEDEEDEEEDADNDDNDDGENEGDEEEEEEDDQDVVYEDDFGDDSFKRKGGQAVSSALFAHVVAINGEAEFLEQRVRSMAAALASRLPDDDPVFGVPFAESTSEDRLRYCTEMIPLLLERLEQKK